MSMIQVNHLTFSYSNHHDVIFDDVSFIIDSNWKLGLVGRNGRGKTTFLNLLLGKYKYQGSIYSPIDFTYFPYEVEHKELMTVDILMKICPEVEEWELMREFSYLNLNLEILYRAFDTLSNGEQTKVLLSALFLKHENFLLIDEPTNHLDISTRKQIAAYLKQKKSFILVSHDRYLLDECVDHILSINRANIEVRSGNFTNFVNDFEKNQQAEINKNKRIKKEIKRLEYSTKQTEKWARKVEASKQGAADKGFVGHKAAKMMKRSKNIEARKDKWIKEKTTLLSNVEVVDSLMMKPLRYHKKSLVSYQNVAIYYEKNKMCDNITLEVKEGERVFIHGVNGSGKSSLLKLLFDQSISYSGEVLVGANLKISYVSQDTTFLKGSLKQFASKYQLDESIFQAILRKLGFERIQFEKNIEDFSAGQKKKVLLAKSLCEKAHLYVWDEPFNYIDIFSRRQIEQVILESCPTMLIVEHDHVFEEKIATKIIKIDKSK